MGNSNSSAVLRGILTATTLLLASCGWQAPLVTAIEPLQTHDNSMQYTVSFEGDMDDHLRPLLNDVSELVSLIDRPPFGLAGLRHRAQQDMERMQRVLHAEGYYASEVTYDIRSDISPAIVSVLVDTGPVFLLEDYVVRYIGTANVTTLEELPQDIEAEGLYAGMPALAASIVEAQKALLVKLDKIGRPFAAVVDRSVVVDHDRNTMRVSIDVDPGSRAHFGETHIEGNEEVETAYLQRLIPWNPRETFANSDLETYRAQLVGTGLFERVQVSSSPQVADDGSLDVLVNVLERKHRSIGVGLGYSSDQGPSADAYWENRNMWGRQELLRVGASVSASVQTLSADMRKPHYLVLDQNLLFNASVNKEDSTAFDEESLSTFVGIERKKWDIWTFRGGPSLEYSSLYNRDTLKQFNFALLGFPLSANRDSTDDLLDPHQGSRLSFLATPYYGTISSDVSFLSLETSGSAYQAVDESKRVIFAGRFRVGTVGGETTLTLPANKRLYAGGGGSVRGYKHRMVGPISATGAPSGGRSVAELGLESRIMVTQNVGIVPFFEGGGVYDDMTPHFPNNAQWAGGLGLRYHTIVGPLRADVAFPLNGRPDIDSTFEFYISIGQAF